MIGNFRHSITEDTGAGHDLLVGCIHLLRVGRVTWVGARVGVQRALCLGPSCHSFAESDLPQVT